VKGNRIEVGRVKKDGICPERSPGNPYLTRKQQEANEESRWAFIRSALADELRRFRTRYPRSRRVPVLKALLAAAARGDAGALLRAAERYVRLTRVIPPGCWALRSEGAQTVYLDGERGRGRLRDGELVLQVWHPQVYR
jgi:hypothetical protein